jgi:hypothetical protein
VTEELIPNRVQDCNIERRYQQVQAVTQDGTSQSSSPHLTAAEVKEKMRTASDFRRQQKWWIVYNALVEPRTAAEIAKHTGERSECASGYQ